jgi:hypothetical protein
LDTRFRGHDGGVGPLRPRPNAVACPDFERWLSKQKYLELRLTKQKSIDKKMLAEEGSATRGSREPVSKLHSDTEYGSLPGIDHNM